MKPSEAPIFLAVGGDKRGFKPPSFFTAVSFFDMTSGYY